MKTRTKLEKRRQKRRDSSDSDSTSSSSDEEEENDEGPTPLDLLLPKKNAGDLHKREEEERGKSREVGEQSDCRSSRGRERTLKF